MSALESHLIACKDLQLELQSGWGTNVYRTEPLPLLSALMQFSKPMEPVMVPGDGKVRKLQTTFFPPLLESSVVETSERTCVATNPIEQREFTYELDTRDILQTNFFFEAENFTEFCGSNAGVVNNAIAQHVEILRKKAATRIAEQVALMPGNYATDVSVDGNNAFVVPTLQNTAGDPAVATLQKIDFATRMQSGYAGPMIIAGGDTLYNYIQLIQSGCCYNGGIDIRSIFERFNIAALWDRRLTTELNGTGADSLVIDSNAIQIVNYVQSGWKNGILNLEPRIIGGTGWGYIFEDTTSGLLIDIRMSYNCDRVDVVMDTVVKAFNLPDNLFKVGDVYEGINFIGKLKVTNPV
jgi:hypothetical protein